MKDRRLIWWRRVSAEPESPAAPPLPIYPVVPEPGWTFWATLIGLGILVFGFVLMFCHP